MRFVKRVLQVALVVVVLLVVVGCGGGYWFITHSHPQIDGTLRVAGLKSQVEIVRDSLGIPHIYASNTDDLFFAQGFVQAQDRLWQMEYNRRVGHGTLSDIFGAATIKQDRFLRTIGLGRAAQADTAAMTESDKRPLHAYANGVNAFIDTHLDNLPLEFTILGIKPTHWQVVDTLAWGKVMAYDLGGNYQVELLRASIIEKLGPAKAKELLPPYPAAGPFTIPTEAKEYRSQSQGVPPEIQTVLIGVPDLAELRQINASLGLQEEGVGSNNWVIDGSKSTTGKPILSNDPHLSIQMPSIWYQVGLHCVPQGEACPYNVAGYTFPGVPGIVIGHNDRIAWGVTNVNPDVQDLYVEEVNPQNPNQYRFNGQWEEMQVVEEPIKVKGVVSETLQVQITRHGPVMTPVLSGGITQPLALQWTALRERSRLFPSVLMLNRARNWDDFRAALRHWDAPSQNFVYADVEGNIGYQMPGNIPVRAKGDGTVPAPGTGEFEWKGYVPFEELPFVFNPPTHFVATANQAVVPPTYKYLLGTDWAAPYREERILALLKEKDKYSVEDMKRIQGDVYSIPLAQLQRHVVGLTPEGFLQTRAMQQVKSWDGRLTQETVGGTVLEATFQRLFENVFGAKMDKGLLADYRGAGDYHRRAILALLDDPGSEWWGEEGRAQILKRSYAEAVDWLGNQFGDAPGDWKWGRLHTATFTHPLGSVQPLNLLFNAGPLAAPGGVNTIFATSFKVVNNRYNVSSVSSMRMIIDLANLSNSLQTNTTGQSGQPLQKHFSDSLLMWRDVQYAPYHFDRASVDRVREGFLVLVP